MVFVLAARAKTGRVCYLLLRTCSKNIKNTHDIQFTIWEKIHLNSFLKLVTKIKYLMTKVLKSKQANKQTNKNTNTKTSKTKAQILT